MYKRKQYILLFIILFIITGCFNTKKNNTNNQDDNQILTTKELSIDDFDWNIEKAYHNKEKNYYFSLKNNSNYTVLYIEIQNKITDKNNTNDSRIFDKIVKKIDNKDEFNYEDLKIVGYQKKLTKNGESIEDVELSIEYNNKKIDETIEDSIYALTEPELLTLKLITDNNKLYTVYYDFNDKNWYIDKNIEEINKWPDDNEIAKLIPQINHNYETILSDEDSLIIGVYGVTIKDFEEYKNKIAKAGFNNEVSSNSDYYYSAKDNNNNEINLSYRSQEQAFYINGNIPKENEITKYYYDTSKFTEITAADIKKLPSGKTIVVWIGRQSCGWSSYFAPVMEEVSSSVGFTPYYIDLGKIIDFSQSQAVITDGTAWDTLTNLSGSGSWATFASENMGGTPLTLVIKNNKVVGGQYGYSDAETLKTALKAAGIE